MQRQVYVLKNVPGLSKIVSQAFWATLSHDVHEQEKKLKILFPFKYYELSLDITLERNIQGLILNFF